MKTSIRGKKMFRVQNRETGEFGQFYRANIDLEDKAYQAQFPIEFVVTEEGNIEQLETGQITTSTPWKISDPNCHWGDGTPTG